MDTTTILDYLLKSVQFRNDKYLKNVSFGQCKVCVLPNVENIEPVDVELASAVELKLMQTVADVFKDQDIPSRVYLQINIEKGIEMSEMSLLSVQDVSSFLLDIKRSANNIKEIIWDESMGKENPHVKVASLENNKYWLTLDSDHFFIRRCYEKIVSEVFRLYSLRLNGMPENVKDRMLILGNPGIGKVCSSCVYIYLFIF
jgi:hypothetical protein